MIVNVGNSDRAMRVVAGVLILGLGFYFKSYWGLIGIVPLVMALPLLFDKVD